MKTNFYLTVTDKGSVRVTKSRQGTKYNEVSIACELVLPNSLFTKPQINATITIDQKNVMPFVINADTTNLVKDAIQSSTGLEVKLTVINPEVEL